MSEVAARSSVTFIRALAMLALDADTQLAWLQSLEVPGARGSADELAMEFDDGYRLLWAFASDGWVTEEVRAQLTAIDAALTSMSGPAHEDLWDPQALSSQPQWEHIRHLARRALLLIR